jgi:S-adenosyl-L-methionine hydrolase (adenosine-forming)
MLPLSFLSDYGHGDEFVGVCHGVVQRIAVGAVVIDVTHDVPRHDVRLGALSLQNAIPYLPQGVHIAVVDPGVGSKRRAVALRAADGNLFVGPDNGLLWPAAQVCGGVVQAVDIAESPHRLEPVSATFHGRDLFAPVAAHLALGAPLENAGRAVDPGTLERLELSPPELLPDGRIRARVVAVDRFGNLQLNLHADDMRASGFELGDCVEVLSRRRTGEAIYARTFADVGEQQAVIIEDSAGRIAVAVNRGRAAGALGVDADAELLLQPCDDH